MPEWLWRIVLVGVGGGAGSIARYGVWAAAAAAGQRFPLGTLLVNVTGCVLAGVFAHFAVDRGVTTQAHRHLVAIGFLGGLTTFSAFAYDTAMLTRTGDTRLAALNVGANVALSLLGVWCGWTAARAIWG
jgi:fluoride exporter